MKKRIVTLALLLAALTACDNPERDRCEQRGGDWQAYNCQLMPVTMYVMAGKVLIPITTYDRVCDHHCVGGDGSGWH
jgi:hypothetical protein